MSCLRFQSKSRETRLSPRRAPRRSLLPLSPKRTQVRLKSLLYLVWLAPDSFRTHGRPPVQECRLRLKRPASSSRTLARHLPFKSSTAARSCSYGFFPWAALLRFAFGQKIWHTIFFSPKPNFKIFPKLLPSLAELLSLRKAGSLRYFRAIRLGASEAVSWERFTCRRVAPAFWLSSGVVSHLV